MSSQASNVIPLRKEREGETAVESALQRLADEHEMALRRFVRVRLAGHPDHEDLVQEVFLRVARQDRLQERLSRSADAVRSYLFSIATNIIRDRYRQALMRKKHDEVINFGSSMEDAACSAEDIVSVQEQRDIIKSAILKLTPSTRDAFMMSRFEGLSYRQIADRMNISVSMVEKHVMRALSGIRQRIDRHGT